MPIRCPVCGTETSVLETRDTDTYSRRRRICKSTSCGKKISTLEFIVSTRRPIDAVLVSRRDLDALRRIAERMTPFSLPPSSDETADDS